MALDVLFTNFFLNVMIRFINFLLSSNIWLDLVYRYRLKDNLKWHAIHKRTINNYLLCHGDGFHFIGPHLTVILLRSLSVFLPLDLAFTASQIII